MANEKFIKVDDVCALIGFKRTYVYKLVYEKKIPYYKPTGGTLFFKESEIIAMFNQCKIKADYEE